MNDVEKLIEDYEATLVEVAHMKYDLAELKGEKDLETAKINSKTKEEWKELDITNEQGRKAYAVQNLQEYEKRINKLELDIRMVEINAEILKRKINYQMECFKQSVIS